MGVDSSISLFFHSPFSNLNQKVAWFIFFPTYPITSKIQSWEVGGGKKKKEIKTTKLVSPFYILHVISYCKSISKPFIMYVRLRVIGVVDPFPFQRREYIPVFAIARSFCPHLFNRNLKVLVACVLWLWKWYLAYLGGLTFLSYECWTVS